MEQANRYLETSFLPGRSFASPHDFNSQLAQWLPIANTHRVQAKGSKDIFVNILTDTGLVQRYITDWAGPTAIIKSISLRLGVPWYAYDMVTFAGEVTAVEDGVISLKVVGSNSLGDHVIATATLTIGGNP